MKRTVTVTPKKKYVKKTEKSIYPFICLGEDCRQAVIYGSADRIHLAGYCWKCGTARGLES